MGRSPILKYCVVCGKELRPYGDPDFRIGQTKYCGAVCARAGDAKKRLKWAKDLTFEQLRHWYAT